MGTMKELAGRLNDRGTIGLISYSNPTDADYHLWASINIKAEITPEKKLMMAVLDEAFHCLRHWAGKKPAEDALAWIEDRRDEYLFSFESCCTTLGLAPDYVRRQIKWAIKKPLTEYAKAS